MSGISDIKILLEKMQPSLNEGQYIFATFAPGTDMPRNITPLLLFKEREGTTVVIAKSAADQEHISYESVWAWITMDIHSDLEAVGFTAAFSTILGNAGISVNVVAAFYHDHLFVPYDKAETAMSLLQPQI